MIRERNRLDVELATLGLKEATRLSRGFEIETELSVHALELDLPVGEVSTPYYARPAGSNSKLSTWRDGLRILSTIVGGGRAPGE